MRRLESLTHAPSEARKILRDNFSRYLPVFRNDAIRPGGTHILSDEAALSLFRELDISYENNAETARRFYESTFKPDDGEPTWEELIDRGWIRLNWGHFSSAFHVPPSGRMEQTPTLALLLGRRFERQFKVRNPDTVSSEAVPLIELLEQQRIAPEEITCVTPGWVAARLWDTRLSSEEDLPAALRIWMNQWEALGSPMFAPSRAWHGVPANAFRQAAFNVFEEVAAGTTWEQQRDRMIREQALRTQRPTTEVEKFFPAVPADLIGRVLSLRDPTIERYLVERLDFHNSLRSLFNILLMDVEVVENAPAPHPLSAQLFDIAIASPELLLGLGFRIDQNPKLLADLVLHPPTSALACLKIAQWETPRSPSHADIPVNINNHLKTEAFADAMGVMSQLLKEGKAPPDEAAALLRWHHHRRPGFVDDIAASEVLLATFRDELAGQSTDTLNVLLSKNREASPNSGLGTPDFAAALDLIDIGALASQIDPQPLVEAYIQSIDDADYALSAHRIGKNAAHALVQLASRTLEPIRERFLRPLQSGELLTVTNTGEDNPYTAADEIARSIRAHIRILCRAIVASAEDGAPDVLLVALIDAVGIGLKQKVQTNPEIPPAAVGLFAARHERDGISATHDRPLAADLGATLSALPDVAAKRILVEFLKTDEPMIVAQLLEYAPYPLHDQIKARLETLKPAAAGEVRSLPETQARISALLSVGALDAAAEYMDEEEQLRTLGPVPGRDLLRWTNRLRLAFQKENWAEIESGVVPAGIALQDTMSAEDTLNMFKGLTAIKKPGGDLEFGERAFAQLHGRHPRVPAYVENLFAARISLLLRGDVFRQLRGEEAIQGRRLLEEAEQMMGRAMAPGSAQPAGYACNKGVLLLALGESDRAIASLLPFRHGHQSETVITYVALAQAREGHVAEALSSLRDAERTMGSREMFLAARENIENGEAYAVLALALSQDDQTERVKSALGEFSGMPHVEQARALRTDQHAFESLVMEYVGQAGASLTGLVPMMRSVIIDDCEDDLNAIVRELLSARFAFLGWSWKDQSKGGYASKGPGERDLVLHHIGSELAVVEAVVCAESPTRETIQNNLRKHFQKLFGYTSCALLFHVTYAYIPDIGALLDYLEQMAVRAAPEGFRYLKRDPIPQSGTTPARFVAMYRGPSGFVRVVFHVLDMGQRTQRAAARLARES